MTPAESRQLKARDKDKVKHFVIDFNNNFIKYFIDVYYILIYKFTSVIINK